MCKNLKKVRQPMRFHRWLSTWIIAEAPNLDRDLNQIFRNEKNFCDTFDRMITGSETWCFHYDPETKSQSMRWKINGSRQKKRKY